MLSPSASTTARNTAFSSWRTLPGQRMVAEQRQRLAADRAHALALFGGDPREEMPDQVGDVFARARAAAAPRSETRAGGRTGPRGSGRLLTSSIRLRLVAETIRTSTLTGLRAADRLDLALLDRAQQLHLRGQRQFADLVEEQRAAGGLDELAGVLLGRAGEGALLVAEQDRTRRGCRGSRRN